MLKKFVPAFMLALVVTVAFAFTPVKESNALAQKAFTYNPSTGVWTPVASGDVLTLCQGGDELCGIIFDDSQVSEADAKARALNNYEDAQNGQTIQNVTIYKFQ